ncbi:hypothetical protein V6N13_105442 [Hibiscus sabdariffa]|uniref:Uncharacterized protein n=1 Tax=Hibiscus sabdariffa TaxID=183260 RepID=A0ABR2EXT6_9ROSI
MVKIALVVFSLVSVLLIQFTGCQDTKATPPALKEKKWFINTLKAAVEDLAKQGAIAPKGLNSGAEQADFEEAYEVAKNETAHQIATAKDRGSTSTDAQLSMDDEKSVFYSSLAYVLEKWASKGIIDRTFMQNNHLTGPGKALEAKFDSQLTKVFEDARRNQGNAATVN